MNYKIHESEGAFFLWIQFAGLRKKISELYPLLKEKGVIIVPGKYFYPVTKSGDNYGEDSIRMSFAREDSEIQEGIRKIGEILSTYMD